MIPDFNIDQFISRIVTQRAESFFNTDLSEHENELFREINGKSALVIGGAGTIGSSYIHSLLRYFPKKVIVVDINENGLTELVRQCRSNAGIKTPAVFKTYPINFSDKVFDKIMQAEGPFDIVANFAAHKHVRSEKDIYSIEALLQNNVIQAGKLMNKLVHSDLSHFFCVSTDKAANPVNIMGASKKLMELLILSYAHKLPVTTARFANVAFSNGSLLAGFLERISRHQPLSCPSDVKRFFVSPQESGQICLIASVLGTSGDIFFPKLGEQNLISFAEIAKQFISAMGYQPLICTSEEHAKDCTGKIIDGLYPLYLFESETSGEKLFEEFYTPAETPDFDKYHSLGVIKNKVAVDHSEILKTIEELEAAFSGNPDKGQIIAIMEKQIPEFKHMETGKNLDQKM